MLSKIKRKLNTVKGKSTTLLCKILFKVDGVKFGKNLNVRGLVKLYNYGNITIGNNVTINSALWANPISSASKTCLQIFEGGVLKIDDFTGVSNTSITCQKCIHIGKHVLIGANCQIYDTDFHPLEPRYRYGKEKNDQHIRTSEIVIEDGVFIGANTIILKGSIIGRNSIIGAGSVVSGIIPDNQIWAGAPARFIKFI